MGLALDIGGFGFRALLKWGFVTVSVMPAVILYKVPSGSKSANLRGFKTFYVDLILREDYESNYSLKDRRVYLLL